MDEHQTKRDEALQLAKTARQDLFEEKKPITNLLLQCKTICRYLGISDENQWIVTELDGYYVGNENLTLKQIKKSVPPYRLGNMMYFDTRNNPVLMGYEMMEMFAVVGVREPISEIETSDTFTIIGSRLIDKLNEIIREQPGGYQPFPVFKAVIPNNVIRKIIIGVRNRIGEFLDKAILELEYGGIPEHIFENIRKEVDHKLISTCPNAIEKLKVTYEKISASKNLEDWSHVQRVVGG